MLAGGLNFIYQLGNFIAEQVVNRQAHIAQPRKRITDACGRIEGVGVVLFKPKFVRHRTVDGLDLDDRGFGLSVFSDKPRASSFSNDINTAVVVQRESESLIAQPSSH